MKVILEKKLEEKLERLKEEKNKELTEKSEEVVNRYRQKLEAEFDERLILEVDGNEQQLKVVLQEKEKEIQLVCIIFSSDLFKKCMLIIFMLTGGVFLAQATTLQVERKSEEIQRKI
jgi:hypothetical protein